jgi:hypothetical protein
MRAMFDGAVGVLLTAESETGAEASVRAEAASHGLASEGMRRLALGEMARGRRRLGALTPEQERALESLLVSVADNISDLLTVVASVSPRHEHG